MVSKGAEKSSADRRLTWKIEKTGKAGGEHNVVSTGKQSQGGKES